MSALDANLLDRFVRMAGDRLSGDWVVIGGCVLPLLGVQHRVTVDIDIAGPDETHMGQMLILMEIAEELELPVESINQAGSHFLRLVDDWADNLIEIHRGTQASLHVPNPTLYLLLKVRRLTEADLLDCLQMLKLAKRRQMSVDVERVRGALQQARAATRGREGRLEELLRALGQLA